MERSAPKPTASRSAALVAGGPVLALLACAPNGPADVEAEVAGSTSTSGGASSSAEADSSAMTDGGTAQQTGGAPDGDSSGAGELPVDPAALQRVCDRGAADPVAKALCSVDQHSIESLADLLDALGLGEGRRRLAVTINSSSVAARSVTSINPRVLVFPDGASADSIDPSHFLVAAFVRGEPVVEAVAWDPEAEALNFYAVAFARACDVTGCELADDVTERIESGWTEWTLYQDVDLVNTPIDCLVCHQPFGPDTPKAMLMQEFAEPWLHWLHGGTAGEEIPERSDALARFLGAHAGESTYAGVPLAELAAPLSDADGFRGGPEALTLRILPAYSARLLGFPQVPPGFHDGMQPSEFDSRSILRDAGEGHRSTWEGYRTEVEAGLRIPIPSDRFDPWDEAERDAAAASLAGFTAGTVSAAELLDPRALAGPQTRRDLSVEPTPGETAQGLFRHFCRRCHNDRLDPSVSRARFDVDRIDDLDPLERAVVVDRLRLPADSPFVMPPRRMAELPAWAIDAMVEFVEAGGE